MYCWSCRLWRCKQPGAEAEPVVVSAGLWFVASLVSLCDLAEIIMMLRWRAGSRGAACRPDTIFVNCAAGVEGQERSGAGVRDALAQGLLQSVAHLLLHTCKDSG
jgi:hypothetical protein